MHVVPHELVYSQIIKIIIHTRTWTHTHNHIQTFYFIVPHELIYLQIIKIIMMSQCACACTHACTCMSSSHDTQCNFNVHMNVVT